MRIAHDVTLDQVKGELRIDGTVFPFYIAEEPGIDVDSAILRVNIGLFADNVTIIGRDKSTGWRTTNAEQELAWARVAARDIVLAKAVELGLVTP